MDFNTFCFETKLRSKLLRVIIWSKLAILGGGKLGADNNL